jgi:RHS repeat-associated protein
LNILGLLLLAILAVLVPLGAGAQEEPPPPSSTSVWYAAGTSLVQVDAESGQAAGSVPLSAQSSPVSNLASHPTDGSVAVLAKGRLLGFDTSGNKTFEEPVAAASSLGTAPVLASDPHDGSLWVGGSGVIVLADASGQNQRTVKLNTGEVVKAIFASQGGGAYALTQSRLLRLSKAGEVISQRPMSTGGVKSPTYLAVDEYGGLGYVANATEVAQVSLGKPGDPPIRNIRPKGGVGALAVNPFDGTLYVASRPSRKGTVNLYAYDDGNGLLLKKESFQALAVRALSFDTPSQTLWAGTDAKVLGFQKDLSSKAQVAAAGLNTLAAAPLSLSSHLSLLEPQNGDLTNNPQQQVRLHLKAFCNNETCPAGFTYGSKLTLEATLNGQDVSNLFQIAGDPASQSGAEATYVPQTSLPEGENNLVAEGVDPFGIRSNHLEASFTVDTGAPTFSGVPSDITQQATDSSGAQVNYTAPKATDEVDGEVPVNCDPASGSTFPIGTTTVTCTVTDKAGNEATASFNVTVEEATTALDLSISEPQEGSTVSTDRITVKGTVTGPSGTKVTVADIEATVDTQGNFTAEGVPLTEGPNAIVVKATSPSGQSVEKTLNVTYEPPGDPSEPPVRTEGPPDSPVPTPGTLPSDPQQVAPPVSNSTAIDMADSTRFLYEGENALQTGVEPGAMDEKHVAVIKGKVSDRLGDPVPGVRITVLDHPEYGQTLSREDGQFDLAVNGGGTVTLVYEKDHYMPAQRQVEAPWRDFATVEDVVLVEFSERVTDIDLESTNQMLAASGSSVTDEDGTRQATVLFPGDTAAEMVMPDGTTQPLPQMDFRAIEYTVGENGPESMPADLPPASGYTYAVELSVDEAVEAGASKVRFTKPVYTYVENFLQFPVGSDVPTGYYDREKGVWVPSEDGRIIKVLSITNGLADLDVDGSGNPAGATALEKLRITDEERAKLAGLYEQGQSMWRVPIDHFTPYDCNWPYGPPDDAEKPDQPPPPDPRDKPKPDCEKGSVIDCHNQILGENLNVSGAPFYLHYGSDGVPDRKTSRTLDIPLSVGKETLPASLKRIDLEVRVAGQTFRKSFPAEPNQSYTFAWDGKDAYGRIITGDANVKYQVGYVYPLVYKESEESFARSFGLFGGADVTARRGGTEITVWQRGEVIIASWDDRGQGMGGWTPDILHQYDPETGTLRLGNGDRRRGDTYGRTISTIAGTGNFGFFGDGGPAKDAWLGGPNGVAIDREGALYIAEVNNQRIRKVSPDGIITTVAGNGQFGFSGDGGPAKDAKLAQPWGVDVGPDDTLYIADSSNNRIRKVSPDGTITTVAGSGQFIGFSGDGGPAKDALLASPEGLAVGPDGTLYIADTRNNRIRKVSPDGIITTVAGNGQSGFSGDGGPAKDAKLGLPRGVDVGPDGTLYIADTSNDRIRKVSPDGTITTVAGKDDNGQPGFSGDGGPAKDALLNLPTGVAVAPEGNVYIADRDNRRIRKVSPDGTITTVAGSGQLGFSGDGGPAKDASQALPTGVAVAPEGTIYIADRNNSRVRKVDVPRHGVGASNITFASEDGTELYHFDRKGKHLRTLDSVTGTVLYRFSYDGEGRLTAVEDMDGLTTQIERDASGNATAIVAPNGERTELSLDANGYLASVTNPAQETVRLTYNGEGGLLESLTDPKNNTTRFSYDAQGRLTKDEDPAGGYKALSRTRDGERGSFTASVAKASGRKNTYAVENPPDGSSRRLNTDASGLKTEKIIGTDGDEKVTTPDGTVVETSLGPDPRFGMQSPVLDQATLKTPGGRSMTIKSSRQATLANPADPLSAPSITEKVQIGTRTWTSTFDKTAKTIKGVSPEGRSATTTVDAKGRPVLTESSGSAPESYEYDQRGRLTKVTAGTGAEARTTTYAYDEKDRVSSVTDPSGKQTRFEYDEAGRLVRQTGPNNRSVSFSYDKNGNLTSVTPPGRSAHEFTYDSRDLVTSYSAPQVGAEESTTSLERDLDRLPTSKTLPGGGTIEYSYDAGGRRTKVNYPGGEKSYTYDPATGKVATMSNANGTLSYAFDGILPISETSGGQVSGKVELKYGPDLRVSGISVNGTEISYTYDNDDLITKAGSLNVSRDAERGLVTGTTLSDTTDQRSYNAFGEPDSYEAFSGTTQQYKASYKRDSLGRIIEKTETVEGTSTTYAYSYDDEGRLEEVKQDGEVVASYAYDENGNRLSRTTSGGTTEGSYDAQDRLTSYGENEYVYAPDGHLESKTDTDAGEITSYTHDAMGNLLSATLPDGRKVEYVVDARDRRVGKKVNGQLEQGFLYQGQLSPIAELDGAGNIVSRFVYATKPNVPDYMEKGGKTYRIISDHLGSVRLVVDASTGEVAQRLDYDEFGQVINDTNPGFQPFGYAGGLYDRDTGLVRFGARDYDAETGRWVSKDQSGFDGGLNFYAYAYNDPINLIDPEGKNAFAAVSSAFGRGIGFAAAVPAAVTGGLILSGGVIIGIGIVWVAEVLDNQPITDGPTPDEGESEGGVSVEDATKPDGGSCPPKRYSPDQEALIDIAKEGGKTGVTDEEADTLLQWGQEYGNGRWKNQDHRGTDHWVGGDHIHTGGVGHIPVRGGNIGTNGAGKILRRSRPLRRRHRWPLSHYNRHST